MSIFRGFRPLHLRIRTDYGHLQGKSSYSVQMQKNTDHKNPNKNTFHAVLICKTNEFVADGLILTFLKDFFTSVNKFGSQGNDK